MEKDGFTGILNATSSVVAIGERTARVGIADPKADGYGQIVMLHGKALATSGVNQRFFTYQGKNYHHIIDLKTGYPTDNGTVQASVICDDAAWADVYATAALIQGTSNVPALLYFENGETKTFEEWNHVTQ